MELLLSLFQVPTLYIVKPLLKENYATRLWQEQSNFRKYLQGTLLFPSNKDILNLVVVLLG